MLMRMNEKENKKTIRRVYTVYLDELPAIEAGILHIKLDTSALSKRTSAEQARAIDPDSKLAEFLRDVADAALSRRFASTSREEDGKKRDKQIEEQVEIRKAKREKIDAEIAPELAIGLSKALSSVVSNSSIEQKLLVIHWPPSNFRQNSGDVLAGTRLNAEDESTFKLFISDHNKGAIQYDDFRNKLLDKRYAHGAFTLNAIEEAARTALRVGPVDNEQFFLSSDGDLYRIIVTRHFSYYDGSRVMHMYFVPALRRASDNTPFVVACLLRVAVIYRILFLEEQSELSPAAFKRVQHDFSKVQEKIAHFLRKFLMVEHESHINELDDTDRYEQIYGSKMPPGNVSDLFKAWQENRRDLLDLANNVRATPTTSSEATSVTKAWIEKLDQFASYVEPLNRNAGSMAANRINAWFETGRLPEAKLTADQQGEIVRDREGQRADESTVKVS
jgi:hypothetical protein